MTLFPSVCMEFVSMTNKRKRICEETTCATRRRLTYPFSIYESLYTLFESKSLFSNKAVI